MAPSTESIETFTDPKSGALKPLRISDQMPVPAVVESDGSRILFELSSLRPHGWVRPPSDLLEEFVNAHSNADLFQFAKRFGPLALFPIAGTNVLWPDPERLAEFCDPHYEELSDWRRVQQQVRAVLMLMLSLRQNKTPTMEALSAFNATVGGVFVQPNVLEAAKSSARWRNGLALRAALFYTRTLANVCRITPALRPKKTTLEIVFQDSIAHLPGSTRGGLSLPGALTIQLMSALVGTALAFCKACGRAYVAERRPAADRNTFCPDCGIRAAWRESKRKIRAK